MIRDSIHSPGLPSHILVFFSNSLSSIRAVCMCMDNLPSATTPKKNDFPTNRQQLLIHGNATLGLSTSLACLLMSATAIM